MHVTISLGKIISKALSGEKILNCLIIDTVHTDRLLLRKTQKAIITTWLIDHTTKKQLPPN